MKQIEFKHLSPYLQYELNIIVDGFSKPEKLIGLYRNVSDLPKIHAATYFNSFISLKDIKPILRPLSDLVKEIEHNGEKFVPIEWLDKNIAPSKKQSNTVTFTNGYIEMCYYSEYQKLFEWHFDVFGLIADGLAVDYNSVEF